uniref:Uncharacterized protein n=1 Tax=Desertifilum tharense IPPAS B-1220 TaxID=1781255 RepID=A0ACD5GUZ6_9CYAN
MTSESAHSLPPPPHPLPHSALSTQHSALSSILGKKSAIENKGV